MKEIPTPKGDESTLIIDVNPLHRVPLVFFNLLIFCLSFMVAFVSAVSMVERSDEISFRNRSVLVSIMVNMEVTAFFISGMIVIVSFLGFVGALRENVCFLRWYLTGLHWLEYLCTLMGLASFIIPFASSSSAHSIFTVDMIVSYRDNPDYARLVDTAQASFQCCGVTNDRYRDWEHNIYFNCSKSNPSTERCSVPASCCRPPDGENPDLVTRLKRRFCGSNVLAGSEQEAWKKIFTRNCVDATMSYLRANTFVIIGVTLLLTIVLTVLARVAARVHDEVISLTRLYDNYYRKREVGYRKSLAQMEALDEVRAARDRLVAKREHKGPLSPGSRSPPEAEWKPSPEYNHMIGRPSIDLGKQQGSPTQSPTKPSSPISDKHPGSPTGHHDKHPGSPTGHHDKHPGSPTGHKHPGSPTDHQNKQVVSPNGNPAAKGQGASSPSGTLSPKSP